MSLLKVEELAVRLNLSANTIRNLTKKGTIPSVKVGRSVRYKPEVLDMLSRKKGAK